MSEQDRLGRQCELILDRLRRGPATNRELSGLSLKYTSRISDLRAKGHDVVLTGHDRDTGLTWYALRPRQAQPEQESLWG